MKIIEKIFDSVLLLQPDGREDSRGTIQAFAVDADFEKDSSGIVNYKDPEIGLKLPVEDIIISDYDKNAN